MVVRTSRSITSHQQQPIAFQDAVMGFLLSLKRHTEQPIPNELAAKIFSMLHAVDFPGGVTPKVLERLADPPMTKEGHIAVKYACVIMSACCCHRLVPLWHNSLSNPTLPYS